MSASVQVTPTAVPNRRRRVRQKVHAPAYATFGHDSNSGIADLHEILNISEVGLAIQSTVPLKIDEQVDLSLDLAEIPAPISAKARVVWCDPSGRVGFSLPALPDSSLRRLREWLFLNSMAGAANAADAADKNRVPATTRAATPELKKVGSGPAPVISQELSDFDTAVSDVLKKAASLGKNLDALLSLIATESQSLLHASGAAIALAEPGQSDVITMRCRASAGESAPPVGTSLQVGSGFSGECVRSGKTLRCDDAETDPRVDRESCRVLGIRSMVAVPIGSPAKTIGLLEVFSPTPAAFHQKDELALQKFSGAILAAINGLPANAEPAHGVLVNAVSERVAVPKAVPKKDVPVNASAPASESAPFSATETARTSVSDWSPTSGLLFTPQKETASEAPSINQALIARFRLSRKYLYVLIILAAALALLLGFLLAPWLQAKLQASSENNNQDSTSVPSPASKATLQNASLDPANFGQLRQLALRGDPQAENALGLIYAQGDEKQGIEQDQIEAARWFTKAAEHGSVPAQYKLGLLYWGGHGVPRDANKAYFWAVLARAGGQEGSKDLAKILANSMSRPQAAAIEQQANIWYQEHETHGKPNAGK
jgi:GAF domain/PilZ domain/Sel1 repeat